MGATNIVQLIFKLLVSALLISTAMAEVMTPKSWRVKLLMNVYDQNSSSGDQVFDGSGDERVTVFEPMLFIAHQIDETTNVAGNFTLDAFSSESDTILDANTGESGEGIGGQSRISGNISYAKTHKTGTWTPRVGFSSEYDYKSFNGGLNWSRPFAQDNFILNISTQVFMDQTRLFDHKKDKTSDWLDKEVYSFDISATQMLTRDSIVLFGLTYVYLSGPLESIRNTVNSQGTRMSEELPNSRKRYALYSQYIHALSDEYAASIKYRFYKDDWNIKAHSIETSLRTSLQDEDGFLEFSYRVHMQDQTKYYTEQFNGFFEFRTSDSDLAKFSSHRIGAYYSYDMDELKVGTITFDSVLLGVGAYHYWRTNDLDANMLQFSTAVQF